MIQVRLFAGQNIFQIEGQINNFLRKIEEKDFLDIKFTTNLEMREGGSPRDNYTAVLIYKTGSAMAASK